MCPQSADTGALGDKARLLQTMMARWRIGSTAIYLHDDVCRVSKLALQVRSVIMTFNDRQIAAQKKLAMTRSKADSRAIEARDNKFSADRHATEARDDEMKSRSLRKRGVR